MAALITALDWELLRPATAGNGLNFIGFGLESNAMAGADLAVARDAFALNTNPAGIAQLHGLRVDLHGGAAWELGIEHKDRFSGREDIQNDVVPVANMGITRRLNPYPVTLGTTLAVSGGAGYDYGNIATPFGGQDELSSLFGIVRGSVGGAVNLGRFSIGVGLGLSYSRLDQKIFPNTSVVNPTEPNGTFFGSEINNAQAFGQGVRVGALWRIGERVTLGVAGGSQVDLPVEDGRFTVNLTALGLGKVKYHDLKIKGLAQPAEIGVGIAYEATSRLLIAADVTWLDWSGALGKITLRADQPDDPSRPFGTALDLDPPLARPVCALAWNGIPANRPSHALGRVQLRAQSGSE
jgi:long-chain fatty acid transport protein